MAIATLDIICTVCGETFVHRHECRNSRDRDQYLTWAQANIDTCPTCRRKAEAERAAAALEAKLQELGVTLPTIDGVSEKQVNYADDVRQRYLSQHIDRIGEYARAKANMARPGAAEKFAEYCAANGLDPQAEVAKAWKARGLEGTRVMLESSSAREIIDNARS